MSEQEAIKPSPSQPVRRAFLWAPLVFNVMVGVSLMLDSPEFLMMGVLVEPGGVLISLVAYWCLKTPRHRWDRPAVLLVFFTMAVSLFFVTGAVVET